MELEQNVREESNHKDLTLQRAKLAGEITTLAALITNSTEMDVFVQYSAHVDNLEIDLYQNGWKSDRNRKNTLSYSCYIGEKQDPYSLKELYKIKRQLVQILKDKKINYKKLDYTTETTTYKKYYLG